MKQPLLTFDGSTCGPEDRERLTGQVLRVYNVVKNGRWFTPNQLEALTGDNWCSISARLRDLRKPRFGGHSVERENCGGGLFRYRLIQSGNLKR